MLKSFVISLSKTNPRWQSIHANLSEIGIPHTFIKAIDGSRIAPSLLRGLTPSMVAIALSHIKVCRQIIRQKIPIAIIMEDDARVIPSFAIDAQKAIADADKSNPDEWDIIQFGNMMSNTNIFSTFIHTLYLTLQCKATTVNMNFAAGSHCYCVSLKGARNIVRLFASVPINSHYDVAIQCLSTKKHLTVLMTPYPLAIQDIHACASTQNFNKHRIMCYFDRIPYTKNISFGYILVFKHCFHIPFSRQYICMSTAWIAFFVFFVFFVLVNAMF
jgi:GR25 family glycosyltransferase involved in LPS biosynthesis